MVHVVLICCHGGVFFISKFSSFFALEADITPDIQKQEQGLARLQLQADRENRPALDFYADHRWSNTRLVGLWKKLSGVA